MVSNSGCRLTGGRNAEGSPNRKELDEDYSPREVAQLHRRVRGKHLARIICVWMPCDKGEIAYDIPDLINCPRQSGQ